MGLYEIMCVKLLKIEKFIEFKESSIQKLKKKIDFSGHVPIKLIYKAGGRLNLTQCS